MFSKLFRRPEPLSPQEILRYKEACESLAGILRKNGITHIKPYSDPEVPRLHAHNNPRRAIETLETYVDVIAANDRDGGSFADSKQILWRMLRRLKYSPQSDIFEKIHDHNILEIYTSDNWQIFRNLNFFRHVSMTIDEMATFYWQRDSKRHMKVHLEALAIATRLRFGTLRKTMDLRHWPAHFTKELVGEGWLIEIRLQYVSPLRGTNGEFLGLVVNESQAQVGDAQPSSSAVLPAEGDE